MFYNTKVGPLFDTQSIFSEKNMFYNIFLDIRQKREEQTNGFATNSDRKGMSKPEKRQDGSQRALYLIIYISL